MKKNQLIREFILKINSSDMCSPCAIEKKVMYVEGGGQFIHDRPYVIADFLDYYCCEKNDRLYVKEQYRYLFDAYSKVDYNCTVTIPLPLSFFLFPGMRVMSLLSYAEVKESVFLEKEENYESIDFLALLTPASDKKYEVGEVSDRYIEYVRAKFSKLEIVAAYRSYLNRNAIDSKAMAIKYDNPYEFIGTVEKQFGIYYEALHKVYKIDKKRRIVIPNDGLGLGSIICMCLGANYISNEPFGIGTLGIKLGIISTSEKIDICKSDVVFLGNLSSFFDMRQWTDHYDYVIVDENRFFQGVEVDCVKKSSNGRVVSNYIESDDFIGGGRDVSKALPMLRNRRNIPLSAKAEYFLWSTGLPVYTDGSVSTCTFAQNGGNHYIDTTDTSKGYGNLFPKSVNSNKIDVLNIVSRNYPTRYKIGKLGNLKRYKDGQEFPYQDKNPVVGDDYMFYVNFMKYNDPAELKNWHYLDGFFIAEVAHPERVRFLIQDGIKVYLLYLHDIKGGKWSVFRDRFMYVNVGRDIAE